MLGESIVIYNRIVREGFPKEEQRPKKWGRREQITQQGSSPSLGESWAKSPEEEHTHWKEREGRG